ncbi:E3 SUMO-protein ligase KIAA1586 [Frankliniella fusca]|uniref:E3 SUMO-protein ligase KIAA1586 n=1 Tax=Frankliniella fusca TaxID=407009 RepID=A0AAE1I5H5_9NEOP|nr:E3 SUMO-protein ligase KIAA1586 [Frankliniella fusca]
MGSNVKEKPKQHKKRRKEEFSVQDYQYFLDKAYTGLPESLFKLEPIELISGMREYVDLKRATLPKSLLPLKNLIRTFIVSTAEVERSFNQMNLICNDSRTRTLIINLSSLMFININGPEVLDLNVTSYAKLWLVNHATADRTQGQKREGKRGLVYAYQK